MLRRIDSSLFDWLSWRDGTILELLNIPQRKVSLVANKNTLNLYAIGWSPAENIPCRPKSNCKAVMFAVKGREFWTHLTNEEFYEVFGKVDR